MNLVLVGFMGTGKSAVGRQIGDVLHVPFYDIDRWIEKQQGLSVADLFAQRGEAEFRRLEAEALKTLIKKNQIVISTGGGILLNPENKVLLSQRGILVCLTATIPTLLQRLRPDGSRPLLTGEDPEQRLEQLLREREALYAQCPYQIPTDNKTIVEVAGEVIEKTLRDFLKA